MEQAAIEPNVHWPDVKWTGRSDPSPMFVAATVLLLLPPVDVAPDNGRQGSPTAAAQPDCRRPIPRGDDQGRWMATGRP